MRRVQIRLGRLASERLERKAHERRRWNDLYTNARSLKLQDNKRRKIAIHGEHSESAN